MADYHRSSNPFRRKGPAAPAPGPANNEVRTRESAPRQPPIDVPTPKLDGVGKSSGKVVKHVRVQSPPPSSPDDNAMPRGGYPALEQGEEGRALGYDPFEPALTDESSDGVEEEEEEEEEETSPVSGGASSGAPRNPFSKTLATLERTESKELGSDVPTNNIGKTAMDVEAFQRLLMTGSTGPAASATTSTVPAPSASVGLTDGSSTEASSVSRHSIFESIQDNHSESPRTSQEASEEERKSIPSLRRSASERKKPPPPNSRHGKLINMQLKDGNPRPQSLYSPYPLSPGFPSLSTLLIAQSIASTSTQRSTTDLNKPLPPAPSRTSHDSDRESIFDTEAAGKTPEPPSPSTSTRRKIAPAPPAGRRHGHPVSESSVPQLPSKRLSIMGSDGRSISVQDLPFLHTGNTHSASPSPYPKAPPPPPMRRPGSIRNVSATSSTANFSAEPEQLNSNSTLSPPPAPPPARTPSMRAGNRPRSVASMDACAPSKRLSTVPPPPPPRQRESSRNSLDLAAASSASGPSRLGEESAEKGESARRLGQQGEVGRENAQEHDILADITRLQREIDALRQHQGTS